MIAGAKSSSVIHSYIGTISLVQNTEMLPGTGSVKTVGIHYDTPVLKQHDIWLIPFLRLYVISFS